MRFEWDPDKEQLNRQKHGLSFDEVTELFTSGRDFLEIYDEAHSEEEDRFVAIGPTGAGIVVVVYTERPDDVTRIVSARLATKKELELYRKHQGDLNE